jgi:dUTP pyrophosphatase
MGDKLMELKLKRLHKDAVVPTYGSADSSCADLYAIEDVMFKPGDVKVIRSGWATEPLYGYSIHVYSRSGISAKQEVILLNSVGIIDQDYRGELLSYMKNLSNKDVLIKKGDRYAQISIRKVERCAFIEVDELTPTKRGSGGFGSTGN